MESSTQYIRINGIPEIAFAHVYSADTYHNVILPKHTLAGKEQYIEISYVSHGEMKSVYKGVTYEIKENDVVCGLFDAPTEITCDAPHEHRTVCFAVPFELLDEPASDALCIPRVTKAPPEGSPIYKLINEIIRNFTLYADSSLSCGGQFLQILSELHKLNVHRKEEIPYGNVRYVNRAKEYVYKNLHKPLQQSEIAEHLGISAEYLCAIFKKTEGVPLIRFINCIKLEKIYALIHKENAKLWHAAELYGYSDPNYVSRLYKKYFGMNITDVKKTKPTEVK